MNNNNNNNNQRNRNRPQRRTVTTTVVNATTNNTPRRRPRRPRRKLTNLATNVALSGCAKDYLRALTNPFQAISPLPCIPDIIALPSQKVRVYSRGTFTAATTVNASGVGFVMINPLMSLFGNIASVFHTTATYDQIGIVFTGDSTTPTVGVSYNAMQSPFSSTANGATTGRQQYRLVSCGVRVQYAGTVLNRGGVLNLWNSAGNEFQNSIQMATISSQLSTGVASVGKNWVSVNFVPDDPKYFAYAPYSELRVISEQTAVPTPYNFVMGILVNNSTPGAVYSYETVAHWEVIGQDVQSASASHSDPAGLGAVLSSIPTRNSTKPAQANEQSLMLRALSSLTQNFSGMLPGAVQTAATVYDLYRNRGRGIVANSMQIANAPMIEDAD